MASNERSLGWNTTTSNDGAAAYDSARMIAMELKTLGNGILLTGSYLAISYTGTTLTIADGAAMINGYFYESTSASTIPTSALNGTYTLALIANGSGGSYTVSMSTAGTTTVLTNTVRMALATSAQLGVIGASNYISFATVGIGATGIITSVNNLYPFAMTRQNSNTQYAYLAGGTASLTAANTFYDVTNYAVGAPSTDLTIRRNVTSGEITIHMSGVYNFSIWVHFDTNLSGNRLAGIRNLLQPFMMQSAGVLPQFGVSVYQASITAPITVTPGSNQVFALEVYSTNAGRSVTDSNFTVTRV